MVDNRKAPEESRTATELSTGTNGNRLPAVQRQRGVMILPEAVRAEYIDNLLAGVALNLAGPLLAKQVFHAGFEAGVAGSDVVERDLEAQLPVVVTHLAEDLEVLDRFLFGDLEDDVAGLEIDALQRATEGIGLEVRIVDGGGPHVQE